MYSLFFFEENINANLTFAGSCKRILNLSILQNVPTMDSRDIYLMSRINSLIMYHKVRALVKVSPFVIFHFVMLPIL